MLSSAVCILFGENESVSKNIYVILNSLLEMEQKSVQKMAFK